MATFDFSLRWGSMGLSKSFSVRLVSGTFWVTLPLFGAVWLLPVGGLGVDGFFCVRPPPLRRWCAGHKQRVRGLEFVGGVGAQPDHFFAQGGRIVGVQALLQFMPEVGPETTRAAGPGGLWASGLMISPVCGVGYACAQVGQFFCLA